MNPLNFPYNSVYFGRKKPEKQKLEHPENGTITVVNKKGDEYRIEYKDDKIAFVYKGSEEIPYKAYFYQSALKPLTHAPKFDRHTFSDGSKLDDDQFYSIREPEVRSVQTYLDDLTIRYFDATINKNAKYKGEPIIKSQTSIIHLDTLFESKSPAKTVVKSDGVERFEFKTLDEAKEYFAGEYGIDAEFMNLKQAFLTKEVIDEFVKLNYQGLGKKLFNGLRINCGQLGDEFAKCNLSVDLSSSYNIDIPDADDYTEEMMLDLIEKLDDADVVVNYEEIIFNSNYDWDTFEADLKNAADKDFHQVTECKYAIAHEFVHYLHSKNIPTRQFLIARNFENHNELRIAKEAGGYAAKDPLEFVAEYAIGRLAGKTYSKEADELYKKWGGPDLWAI